MSKRSEAQQARRARERESGAVAEAIAAAEAVPDGPIEFQPEGEAQNRDDEHRELPTRRGNPARDQALEEVVQARQQSEESQEELVSEPQEEQAEPVIEAPAAVEAPKTVRVKIDHEEFDVPEEEINSYGGVKAYQIIKAQEKRLGQANALLAELRQTKQAQQAPQQTEMTPDELIQDAVSKIQISTPEEGAKALAQALQKLVPKAPDTQAITFQAMTLMQATQAENSFVAGNRDLVENPMIRQVLINEKQRRLAALQSERRLPDDWNEFYNRIAVDVRAALGKPAPMPTPTAVAAQPTSNGSAAKEARKASIVALPTAAARATLPEEQKPPTREQLLSEMRKARGQPV